MKYAIHEIPPLHKPTDPGFYCLAEQGEVPHVVEVCIESDSHDLYYVLLPDDDGYKYPLDIWEGALWFGPLDPADFLELTRDDPAYSSR